MLQEKLSDIPRVFPGTTVSCIINPRGELLAQQSPTEIQKDEMVRLVSSLKRAAIQFGEALGQMQSPVIHIHGTSHIFSCYDLGDSAAPNVLAFYSEMPAAMVEMFDTVAADERMAPIVDDLRLLLKNGM
eukprot:tig00020961_g16678.t1